VPNLFVDHRVMGRYLTERLGGGPVTVEELRRYPRGVSRETWFVTCSLAGGTRRLVVRRDLPGGSVCPATLRFEYEVYRRLEATAVPIARALWYEDDPSWLAGGEEFYVRDHIEGSWEVPGFADPSPEFDDLRIEISREHLRKLALIHTCDWAGAGFAEIMDVPPHPSACAVTAVDRLLAQLDTFQIEPFPVVAEAAGWLREHAPTTAPRVSLLKGTNGLGEEVFRDREIVAMSDWELASLGDPAMDFAYMQHFMPTVARRGENRWGLARALEYYEQISGIHVDVASVDYYRIVGALETVIFAHNAALPLVQGTDCLARLAWVSTDVLYGAKYRLAKACGVFAA
jgi:aminoglycoside phosphotransferase (APT) family kinase protein